MVLFNYSTKELTAKIVYYGPGLCGKTTNLQYIHANLPDTVKGKMLSLATKTDRTLFFDFLPIDLGEIRGLKTRVQLYTVPGQVFYNETRKLVLKGADGIVFVADSQAQMLGANIESFKNLEENLKGHGLKLSELSHVIQFNKRDLPKLSGIEELNSAINRYNAPFYESVATTGIGVQDTLKAITKLVLLQLTQKYDPKAAPASLGVPASPTLAQPSAAQTPPPIEIPRPTQSVPVAVSAAGPAPVTRSADTPMAPAAAAASVGTSGAPVAREEAVPAFGSDEIDDLVDEVEETPASEESVIAARPETRFEIDQSALPLSTESEPETGPSVAVATAPPREAPRFEVDHGVDPDWSPDFPETAAAQEQEDEGVAMGIPEDGSSPESAGPMAASALSDVDLEAADGVPASSVSGGSEAEPDGAEVLLTEVVADGRLFQDPGLEVARMTSGQERDIVIPVELAGEGTATRRFALSIKLRLDPVE